ncbi:unnamed protein product, partial [marine sediment metagenome]
RFYAGFNYQGGSAEISLTYFLKDGYQWRDNAT